MKWQKILAIMGDVEDIVTTGTALIATAVTLRPQLDTLKTDVESLVFGPSTAALNVVIADAEAMVSAAQTLLGPGVPEVVAFQSALAALKLELTTL